jgi:hypothetical protein
MNRLLLFYAMDNNLCHVQEHLIKPGTKKTWNNLSPAYVGSDR